MSTIFPGSASVNQEFNGYRFDGTSWNIIGIDLTADYAEITGGKISASVIPDTFATVSYVDQEVGNIDLSPYLTQSSASSTYITQASASTTYATKSELENIDLSSASAAAVAAIVDSAPSTLNTLNELAAALGDDANFASTVTTSLGNKLDASSASTTYLTQVNASTTYLTQASASSSYAPVGSGGVLVLSSSWSNVTSVTFSNLFSNTSYTKFKFYLETFAPASGFRFDLIKYSLLDNSDSELSNSNYKTTISTTRDSVIDYIGDSSFSSYGIMSSQSGSAPENATIIEGTFFNVNSNSKFSTTIFDGISEGLTEFDGNNFFRIVGASTFFKTNRMYGLRLYTDPSNGFNGIIKVHGIE